MKTRRGTSGSSRAPRPSKTCVVCGRPFEWRKKWKRVWDEVRRCSERCRRQRSRVGTAGSPPEVERPR